MANMETVNGRGNSVMKIIAWKCEATGEIFESKTKYQSHLKKLATERAAKRKLDAFKKERKDFFAGMRNTVRNAEQLAEFVKANWDKFCQNAEANSSWSNRKKKVKTHLLLEYITIGLMWRDNVCNSHSAPIGQKTNWGASDKNEPSNYPGWVGNIKYQTNEYCSELGGELWKNTGVNTGTGGYASNYYYDLKLFAADWPAMLESYEQATLYKHIYNDPRQIDFIANEEFDTTEKVISFKEEYPSLVTAYEKANVWKAIKDDTRSIREILPELNKEFI